MRAVGSCWRIEKLVPGGEGMARLADGRIGFASGVAPGDLIEPRVIEEHKRFVRATDFALVESGAARTLPPCPIVDRCGGCDWMHLTPRAQREHKRELVLEALRRTGGFTDPPTVEVVSEGEPLGYRRRLRLHAAEGRLGFFARRSREIVDVERCLVADAAVNATLARVRAALEAYPDAAKALEAVDIRSAPVEPRVAVSLFPCKGAAPDALAPLALALGAAASVSIAGQPGGYAVQRLPLVDGVELHAAPGTFTQVNWEVNRRVVRDIVAEAVRRGAKRALDLYAGAGNFTLPLAQAGIDVLGVEQDPRAVRAGRAAADAAGLRVRLRHADAAREARELAKRGEKYDLVVLDPPREGASAAIEHVAALAERSVACVSCDPVTLARDLRTLSDRGLRLDRVVAYDMFPQTHHVEVVAWSTRA